MTFSEIHGALDTFSNKHSDTAEIKGNACIPYYGQISNRIGNGILLGRDGIETFFKK